MISSLGTQKAQEVQMTKLALNRSRLLRAWLQCAAFAINRLRHCVALVSVWRCQSASDEDSACCQLVCSLIAHHSGNMKQQQYGADYRLIYLFIASTALFGCIQQCCAGTLIFLDVPMHATSWSWCSLPPNHSEFKYDERCSHL